MLYHKQKKLHLTEMSYTVLLRFLLGKINGSINDRMINNQVMKQGRREWGGGPSVGVSLGGGMPFC